MVLFTVAVSETVKKHVKRVEVEVFRLTQD